MPARNGMLRRCSDTAAPNSPRHSMPFRAGEFFILLTGPPQSTEILLRKSSGTTVYTGFFTCCVRATVNSYRKSGVIR